MLRKETEVVKKKSCAFLFEHNSNYKKKFSWFSIFVSSYTKKL